MWAEGKTPELVLFRKAFCPRKSDVGAAWQMKQSQNGIVLAGMDFHFTQRQVQRCVREPNARCHLPAFAVMDHRVIGG